MTNGQRGNEPSITYVIIGSCQSSQFQCNDGKCISAGLVCNNQPDCSGEEDEASCSGMFVSNKM